MKVMTKVVAPTVCLGDRRKMLADLRRAVHPTHVDIVPAELWPEEARISVPAFSDGQRNALVALGFEDES